MVRQALLPVLTLLTVLALFCSGCHSVSNRFERGAESTVVYARTGMHAFPDKAGTWEISSTNFLGGVKSVPCGSRLELHEVQSDSMSLTDDAGQRYRVGFVAKHSVMPFGEWRSRQFSSEPVELPEGLSELERTCIRQGRVEVGMSKAAVLLAIGYPPARRSPDLEASTWIYQVRRFSSRRITFGPDECVSAIQD